MKTFKQWIPFAVTITLFSIMVYGAVQQTIRLGGYNPQIQMAQDMALSLANGKTAAEVTPINSIDISKSLATFVMVFDTSGKVLTSSGTINGAVPVIPSGVIEYTATHGEDRITWQPAEGVRMATIIEKVQGGQGGYVLVGRSMLEIEKLIQSIAWKIFIGWIISLVMVYITLYFVWHRE